ncbi:9109_t:CDS:2 [Scutellospora calospora]|uniref:9109_t:CDS:1 n=1 Tax=Scutellospora calospora TaxID=85575 RepID=A0ACA9LF43_9GLOM|nr:9109_t:CDS:2 [Scutellospora calospora]
MITIIDYWLFIGLTNHLILIYDNKEDLVVQFVLKSIVEMNLQNIILDFESIIKKSVQVAEKTVVK